MIKKFVKNKILNETPTQSVAAAAFIISLAGFASRLLGLVRDRILAGQFGAGDTLDAYYAAFRIPDLIYNLMIVGALSAAFIPVFTELVAKEKEKDAWKLSSGILSLQILITGAISIFLVIFAPFFMHFVTLGYSGEKFDLTVTLTRIMFLSPFLMGISGIIGGALVSYKRFLAYSLAPIFYNLGIIIGAVFFVKNLGPIGLAWGVVLGALMQLLVQYPSAKFAGFSFKPMFFSAWKNKEVRKVLRLMAPRTLTIAASQINFTIITSFATMLSSGSLAVFNFANNIQSGPLGLFGVSFAIAVFPTMSSLAAKQKHEDFVHAFSKTCRQILFFVIPASIFLYVLRAQTVRVLLGTGKFNWDDTILTFNVLGILAASLFAQSLLPLLTRAFYALQDTKVPLYVTIVSETIMLILVLALIKPFGIYGLATAFSVSSLINMLLLTYFLRRRIANIDGKAILNSSLKILIASLVGGLAAQLGKQIIGTQGELDTFLKVLEQLVISGGIGLIAFASACYLMDVKEFFQFCHTIKGKLFRIKKTISEDTGEVSGL